ncbi:MAG: oligosaccharide flippase family protein [Zoogloeaceae bacterium]|nr:oligosaccharide flippase family protein [Zoogloeaceae bacterium]
MPAVLGIATIPYIVSTLGLADYGLLALVTSIVGYFALLDINVSAGSTKYIAQYHASGDHDSLNETVCFSLLVYAAIGLTGMVGLFLSADWLAAQFFAVSPEKRETAVTAIRIAAIGFAVGQIQAYVQSIPGALMRYDVAGRIEAVFGTVVPLASVAMLALGFGLLELVWLRVAMSFTQAVVVSLAIRALLPGLKWVRPGARIRHALLSFSLFSFLSRLAALTYAHADKLIIGARVGVESLTFYVVPATLANRVMSLVFRLSGVMFPHASSLAAQGRNDKLRHDYLLATRYLLFINGAIVVVLATLAQPILAHWLNTDFARAGALVMVFIALAQGVDSLTNLPSLINDGLGHPRVSGLFALSRAALGLTLIFLGVSAYGLVGAAMAHFVASVIMSLAFVWYVHGRTVPVSLAVVVREAYARVIPVLAVAGVVGVLSSEFAARGWFELIASALAIGAVLCAGGYWRVLTPEHRLIFARVSL